MNIFGRFTKRARTVLSHATQEARYFRREIIGPEHILLGLARQDTGIAGQVLRQAGLDVESLRITVEEVTGRGEGAPQKSSLSPTARRVIERTVDEARQLKHPDIEPEHLLLALTHTASETVQAIWERRGLSPDLIRQHTLAALAGER